MKKKTLVASFGLMVSSLTFAGGLLTNTNQNVAFLRNPARDGAIGIDGVYSNPAGVAFLPDGLHLSLNFQSAYQTREITSVFGPFAYGAGNRGESSKLFKGDAKAPVVPSLQAAYNRGRWSYSFNFAIGGGGGKCAFEDGLGSFESQAALLPLLGSEMGINSYSLDSYMRGRQYYYGFQIGAAYKITDNLSAFVGGRLVYATTNYYGYVKNISVNNPVGGEMVGASALFAGQMASYLEQAGQLTAAAEQAARKAEAERQAAELKAKMDAERSTLEIAAAKKEAQEASTLSSVDRMLSGGFEANRGRLPMPISGSYRVVSHFGQYHVEGLKGVTLDNKGINIQGKPGCVARSIYDGEVSAVFGYGGMWNVLVRHGAYISVYCNLKSVSVHKGQKVRTRQALGSVGSDNILQFQLRKETAKLNPEAWLSR